MRQNTCALQRLISWEIICLALLLCVITSVFLNSCKKDSRDQAPHSESMDAESGSDSSTDAEDINSLPPIDAGHIENEALGLDSVTFTVQDSNLREKMKIDGFFHLKSRLAFYLDLDINDASLWSGFSDLGIALGDYNFFKRKFPDLLWNAQKIQNYIQVLTPICSDRKVINRFFSSKSKYNSIFYKVYRRKILKGELDRYDRFKPSTICLLTFTTAEYMIL